MSITRWLVLLSTGLVAAFSAPTAGAEAPLGRAYELVSPGAEDIGDVVRVTQISEDGNTVAYKSSQARPDAASSTLGAVAVAHRTAQGWTSSDANAPSVRAIPTLAAQAPLVFSTDFTKTIYITSQPLAPADVDDFRGDLYRVAIPHGEATWISTNGAVPDVSGVAELVGASADLERVVFSVPGSVFLPDGPSAGLYTRDEQGVRLTSVLPSVLPDGTPAAVPQPAALQGSRYLGDSSGGGVRAPYRGRHAVSDDGRRVYFYDGATIPSPLYVRDGDSRTVQLAGSATFLAASHDGAIAYFQSTDQLTADAPVGGGIYRYDLDDNKTTILTPPTGNPSGLQLTDGWPFYTAMVSDDMSHIYFSSPVALTAAATAGEHNLYRWSPAGTKFIATIQMGDVVSRVSRNGNYAVLQSAASFMGADTGGYQQLYLYDDGTGSLSCASCRPDGSAAQGPANLDTQQYYDSPLFTQPRNLTDDGRLIFATQDHLLAKDVGAGTDVYLRDHGSVSLITSGTSDSDSFVGDNTDDGGDVFFMTRTQLLPGDHDDEQLDLYDARVGGGFPEALPPAPGCVEDDCQGSAGARPGLPMPATSASGGDGKVRPSPSASHPSRCVQISRMTAAQRNRLARTGHASIAVRVSGGGTVTLHARGRLGGRRVTLGTGRRVVRTHGSVVVHITLRLQPSARKFLASGKRLRISSISARLSGAACSSTTTLNLARR